jgi:hypothetical protein
MILSPRFIVSLALTASITLRPWEFNRLAILTSLNDLPVVVEKRTFAVRSAHLFEPSVREVRVAIVEFLSSICQARIRESVVFVNVSETMMILPISMITSSALGNSCTLGTP